MDMTFRDKLWNLCNRRMIRSQKQFAGMIGVSKSTVSRWLSGDSVPDIREGLKIAKALEVPLGFLADDELDLEELLEGGAIPSDEIAILKLYRALRLTEDEALRRLAGAGEPGGRARAGGVVPTIARQDLSGLGRREEAEMRERLGLEPKADRQAADPDDVPPAGRKR